jgi:predicted phosphodiesterase
MNKVKMAVVLPDIHHPYHDKGCIKAVFKFIKDNAKQITHIILLGDQMDMEAASHWNENNKRVVEGKRIKKEYTMFDGDILSPIEKMLPKAEKVFLIGNHEDWVEQAIDSNPQGEGYWEIENNLHLTKRGWKVIPLNGHYNFGKLTMCHGLYTNEFHAKKTVLAYGGSVLYGHTHDLQEYTMVRPVSNSEIHKGKSIGCLCNRSQKYGKNRPNKWVHAFSVVYGYECGWFNEYTINIVKGKFVWNGKLYGV